LQNQEHTPAVSVLIEMKKFGNIRLKGSSIVEVLIALAISTTCIYMSAAIYLGIQRSNRSISRLKAIDLCERYLEETRIKRTYWDETYQSSGYSIQKTIIRHELFLDCLSVHFLVFDASKKKVGELEAIVHE
jgi:hypothetical protein